MRKITRYAVEAFVDGTRFKRDNTEVGKNRHDAAIHLKLHGHTIAMRVGDLVKIKDAGWQTNTTKERLNGILDAYHSDSYIFQKDFEWFLSRHGEVRSFPSNEWVTI